MNPTSYIALVFGIYRLNFAKHGYGNKNIYKKFIKGKFTFTAMIVTRKKKEKKKKKTG